MIANVLYAKTKKSRMISGLLLSGFGCKLCHDICDGPELQPPLLTRPLIFQIAHPVEIAHIMKDEFSVLQTDETGAGIALAALFDQLLNA